MLGVLYESAIHPMTILSTLPSAGIGALLALMLFGLDLSVVALIGIVLLMGIVKKNAIMMIDFAMEAERDQGLTPREAIEQACLLRFRPIMMTTLAALLGALPLVLARGRGRSCAAARRLGRRRPAAEPGDHALHDAGHVPRDGAAERSVARAAPGGPRPPRGGERGGVGMGFSAPFIGGRSAPGCWRSGSLLVGIVAYRFLPVAPLPVSRCRPSTSRRAGPARTP